MGFWFWERIVHNTLLTPDTEQKSDSLDCAYKSDAIGPD